MQIWEVAAAPAQGGPQARMALGICLSGGLAWDCKWQPGSATSQRCCLLLLIIVWCHSTHHACEPWPSCSNLLLLDCDCLCMCMCSVGVLAVALGSGAVQVLALPRSLLQPATATPAAAAPPLARLQPDLCSDAGALGGSLVSTLEWLATPPHNLLLVGDSPAHLRRC